MELWATLVSCNTAFSEQQLVSCDPYDSGCNGGLLETVFRYIKEQGSNGIDTQSSYPYTARVSSKYNSHAPKFNF